jgi:hypothetical protein
MHRPVPMNVEGVALAHEVVRLLDATPWRLGLQNDDVRVEFSDALPAPVVGYRTTTEHDVSIETLAAFLGDGLLDAFSKLNALYAFGEVLQEHPKVVRTGFFMPKGFSGREFVHALESHRLSDDCHVVAYGAVDESALPAPRPGFIRCPIYPSGQRISRLPNGRTRVEHLMTYELVGWVPRWAQNTLFHRGHLGAYRDEWTRLVRHFAPGDGGRA